MKHPKRPMRLTLLPFLATALFSVSALATFSIPSVGSDYALGPVSDDVVDLSLASSRAWQTPGDGHGVYDPAQWAVVFKYTSVNIPEEVTVTFVNHPSRAPVIWLVQGEVVIGGTVVLDGAPGHAANSLRTFAEPGPGGFRGGRGSDAKTRGAGGMGPGGSFYGDNDNHASSGAGYGSPGELAGTEWSGQTPGAAGGVYGNAGVFPLIGGSGAAGNANGSTGKGGGAGGGAILIATPATILLDGEVRANGGPGAKSGGSSRGNRASGGGSGGGIRLIADTVSGNGTLRALGGAGGTGSVSSIGGDGGNGRIRVEAFTNELVDLGNPAFSLGVPEETPRIFRDPATPAIRSVSLDGQPVPDDPRSVLSFPNTDVTLPEAGLATLVIEAENVPLDSEVIARVIRRTGKDSTYVAALTSGTFESSLWTAEVDISGGFSTVQVSADFSGEQ